MASNVPPKKNTAFTYRVRLFDPDTQRVISAPTVAAGDILVQIDGGGYNNIASFTVDGVDVDLELSAANMNGDVIDVVLQDQTEPQEWLPQSMTILTAARTLDELPQAIWDVLTSALDTVGSIGKLLVDNINAAIDSRSSHSAADVWDVATRVLTGNDNLNDPTAGDIAGAVWAEETRVLTGADNLAIPTVEQIRAEIDSNSTVLAAIVADTNELQTDWTDGGRLDLLIDAIKVVTDNLPDNGQLTDLIAEVSAILANTSTDGVVLSQATQRAIADEMLARGVSNVEDSAGALTLAELILSAFESNRVGTTWTIRKSGGDTFNTRTLTVDSDADPVTGVT